VTPDIRQDRRADDEFITIGIHHDEHVWESNSNDLVDEIEATQRSANERKPQIAVRCRSATALYIAIPVVIASSS
jgi:hypothetical protein